MRKPKGQTIEVPKISCKTSTELLAAQAVTLSCCKQALFFLIITYIFTKMVQNFIHRNFLNLLPLRGGWVQLF
jgi:hypothetical protein